MASTQERSFTVELSRLCIPTSCRLLSFSKIAIGLPFSCLEEEQGLQFALLRGLVMTGMESLTSPLRTEPRGLIIDRSGGTMGVRG